MVRCDLQQRCGHALGPGTARREVVTRNERRFSEAGFYQQTLFQQNLVCVAAGRPRAQAKPTKAQSLAAVLRAPPAASTAGSRKPA